MILSVNIPTKEKGVGGKAVDLKWVEHQQDKWQSSLNHILLL